MKDIIDASRYQGTIDWDEFRDKIGGAMLKTVSTNKSLGGIYIDPQFERNYAEQLLGDHGGVGRYKTFTHVDVRANKSRWKG